MISVGNLVTGGSGKTPVVAMLAALVRDAGYVPAVLSRGYRRRGTAAAVVVVSDRTGVRVDVQASGDEPQLLARRLAGIPVVVSANRYRAGMAARDRFGANVLILDDGFQHLQVARTVNLLVVADDDTRQGVLPSGRLREPLDAAARADALLVPGGAGDPDVLARRLGVPLAFAVRTQYRSMCRVVPYGEPVPADEAGARPTRIVALSAIARPERFVAALRERGYDVREHVAYRDHHWFTAADVARVQRVARDTGAAAILTTEKDAVRLEPVVSGAVPFVYLPIDVVVEPADVFRDWLLSRIRRPEGDG